MLLLVYERYLLIESNKTATTRIISIIFPCFLAGSTGTKGSFSPELVDAVGTFDRAQSTYLQRLNTIRWSCRSILELITSNWVNSNAAKRPAGNIKRENKTPSRHQQMTRLPYQQKQNPNTQCFFTENANCWNCYPEIRKYQEPPRDTSFPPRKKHR